MMYQLGWSTLPGLRGITVSEFRAAPTDAPDNERGVAVELSGAAECETFLREMERAFAARRFTNAADAFDTVKAWALERAGEAG
ncbi:MAG TPA: hypothetical protein VF749_00025 [Candidatus Acidoferrum sp.]